MTLPAPFQYKTRRKRRRPKATGRIRPKAIDEGLTGFINGEKASDIEERFARSLWKRNIEFTFQQHYFGPAKNTPGAIQVDFMVSLGAMWTPVQIDGEIAHRTVMQRMEDKIKDSRLNAYFSRNGINNVVRIPDGKYYPIGALDTQDNTDRIVKSLFG